MTEYKNIEKKLDEFEANKIVVQEISIRYHGGQYNRFFYKGRDEALTKLAEVNAELAAKVKLLDEDCQILKSRNTPKNDIKSRLKFFFWGELTYEA